MRLLFAIITVAMLATPATADKDRVVRLETRPGVNVALYYMPRDGAKATLLLLTGGGGGIGLKDGIPTSNNFLVRSRELFAANGCNVAIVGKPSDKSELDGSFRTSPEHLADLKQVIAFLKRESTAPVWLVGTSMGTISATAMAIAADKDEIGGVVLTASVTNQKIGAVPEQNLAAIRLPVLVVHHQADECKICVPREVPQILRGLTNAPVKKEVYVSGGDTPRGNPCEALHRHGFIGIEQEVVDLITRWVAAPRP